MANGKHSVEAKQVDQNNHKSKKVFIFIFLIILILVLVIIFKDQFFKMSEVNSLNEIANVYAEEDGTNNLPIDESSSIPSQKVENSEILEISDFNIDFSNEKQTKISILFTNTSSENVSDFNLNVVLLDSNGNKIISCDAYVDTIDANGTKKINIYSKQDLSQVTDF